MVTPPHDKFWDAPPTRRQLQGAFNKLGKNDAELMAMADTAAIVLNFLCDKLGVQKPDIDAYVETKKAELEVLRSIAKQEAESAEAKQ